MAQSTEVTPGDESSSGFWQRYKWLLIGGMRSDPRFAGRLGADQPWPTPYTYHGTVIQSPQPDRNFTLTGPNGQEGESARFSRAGCAALFWLYLLSRCLPGDHG